MKGLKFVLFLGFYELCIKINILKTLHNLACTLKRIFDHKESVICLINFNISKVERLSCLHTIKSY
ncbi:unnamed protein product [Moneuplotes crassus]|uniref:Uncharacterized protein n=1 Tax=Euplotes crassus TaxID=5936 RepID=A0AAD1U5R1_EUPCR|nr:unnamed protein product [Moneuplotes crassus]